MTIRVGSLVLATDQGLGVLARAFHAHGVITDVLVVRHSSRPTHEEWYPGATIVDARRVPGDMSVRRFCESVDVMLFLETPWDWSLIPFCRERRIKTAIVPMYECMPSPLLYHPDLFICPSLLDLQYYPNGGRAQYMRDQTGIGKVESRGPRSMFIPVPVEVPWKQRNLQAKVFVHNAGHAGLKGRNGTRELIEALQYVKSDAQIIIRSQDHQPLWERAIAEASSRVDVHYSSGTIRHESLYDEGDVFVWPHQFDGLSLPLNEARASGMVIMSTDRYPDNTWLPTEIVANDRGDVVNPLIPVKSYVKDQIGGCNEFDRAVIDPRSIAMKIDQLYGAYTDANSLTGLKWAEDNSWERLKPEYARALEELCE